jgi:UDP-N-acetylglucosamine 3-dehydrogenase
MIERKIRIGLVGAGAMGATHAAAYRSIAGVEITGVWSMRAERAQRVADSIGASVVADTEALFEDSRIEVIDVCAPSAAHRALVVAALAAGKHVICETPLALSLEDAEAMIVAARSARRLLFVSLLMRSVTDYVYLHEQVRSGALGFLRSIALWRLGSYLRPGAADAKPHYSDPSTELMTFDFDVLNWLLGPPERLSAEAVWTEAGTPGEITAVLGYASGANAFVTGSGIMPVVFPYTVGFRAVFEEGVVEHAAVFGDDIPASTLVVHAPGRTSAPLRLRRQNPYASELRHCIDCIRTGTTSELLSAENALRALHLSFATQRSLRDRSSVFFDGRLG